MPCSLQSPINLIFQEKSLHMKTKTILLTLAFCFLTVMTSYAADLNLGTWKLNEAKSKIPAGAPKNTTVVYTAEGDDMKCVVDGVDGAGNATHNEWTGKFDGKDYPVTGDPRADTRSVKKVNEHRFELNNKKDGKVVVTGTIVISADGKSRTLKTSGTDADGKKMKSTAVYDKQ
jgi:hypothetical protein